MKARLTWSSLPIKWKLTLLSSLLLFVLFSAYTTVQYWFVEQWMIKQEKTAVRQNMREILNYFLERELSFDEDDYPLIRNFLEKANEPNQLIRVLDEQGRPVVTVSNDVSEQWVEPTPMDNTELVGTRYSDHRLLVMRSPLTIFQFNGTIEIVKSMERFDKLIDAFFHVMIVCGAATVILSGLGGRLLARLLLKPLQAMADTIRNIKTKGLSERARVADNDDEMAQLMKMFNRMMDQVERSFRQQKQFVEDASHELRTPVAIIEGHLAMLQRWGKNDPAVLEESLQASAQELARLKGLIQELLALTRAEADALPEENAERTEPERSIRQIVKNAAVAYPHFRFELELDTLAGVCVAISQRHLEQIMLIVLDNAVKYSGESNIVRIAGKIENELVRLDVTDYGVGIAEADLPYVMDRFYRVDKARSGGQAGYGLGLAIANRLALRYGGTIDIRSKLGQGTTVSILLKLAQSPFVET